MEIEAKICAVIEERIESIEQELDYLQNLLSQIKKNVGLGLDLRLLLRRALKDLESQSSDLPTQHRPLHERLLSEIMGDVSGVGLRILHAFKRHGIRTYGEMVDFGMDNAYEMRSVGVRCRRTINWLFSLETDSPLPRPPEAEAGLQEKFVQELQTSGTKTLIDERIWQLSIRHILDLTFNRFMETAKPKPPLSTGLKSILNHLYPGEKTSMRVEEYANKLTMKEVTDYALTRARNDEIECNKLTMQKQAVIALLKDLGFEIGGE
jgi:hypothetical protein